MMYRPQTTNNSCHIEPAAVAEAATAATAGGHRQQHMQHQMQQQQPDQQLQHSTAAPSPTTLHPSVAHALTLRTFAACRDLSRARAMYPAIARVRSDTPFFTASTSPSPFVWPWIDLENAFVMARRTSDASALRDVASINALCAAINASTTCSESAATFLPAEGPPSTPPVCGGRREE